MKYWIEAELLKSLDRDRYAIHTEVSITEDIFQDKEKIKKLSRMINKRVGVNHREKGWRPDMGIFPTREDEIDTDSYALMEFTFDINRRNTPSSATRQPKRALRRALEKLEIEVIRLQSAVDCEITDQGLIAFVHELLYELVTDNPEVRKRYNNIKDKYREVEFHLIGTTYKERVEAASP